MGMAMNIRKPTIKGRLNTNPAVDSFCSHAVKDDLSLRMVRVDKAVFPPFLT